MRRALHHQNMSICFEFQVITCRSGGQDGVHRQLRESSDDVAKHQTLVLKSCAECDQDQRSRRISPFMLPRLDLAGRVEEGSNGAKVGWLL